MNKSQLARVLGVSRTYITLLSQGKRHPSPAIVDKLRQLKVDKLSQLQVDASYVAGVDTVASSPKLQTRWGAFNVSGEFDTHPLPPDDGTGHQTSINTLVTDFLNSRRQGLSPRSLDYYRCYLNLARRVVGIKITGQEISLFINSLHCTNGGKRGYHCCLKAFYNWLYSSKSGTT